MTEIIETWNLKNLPFDRIAQIINSALHDREFRNILMHQYGSLILAASKDILKRTHRELMIPLGDLTEFIDADTTPNWSLYKRNQRSADNRAQAMALIEWNRRRKERIDMLREIGKKTRRSPTATIQVQKTTILEEFVEPFSHKGNRERKFQEDLQDTLKRGISHILPWRQMIIHQITEGATSIDEFQPVTGNKKKDKALHFQFINEMAHNGLIRIKQGKHLGNIKIAPMDCEETDIQVRDHGGVGYHFCWSSLNQRQKQKIINDLRSGRVVLAHCETEDD